MSSACFPDLTRPVLRVTSHMVGDITRAIPDASVAQYYTDGTSDVDVPWTLHNMTALSRMLLPCVSTIFEGYRWPGKNRPYYHQIRVAEFLSRNHRGYCFAGMGTGKTRAACWAADYLMTMGVVKRALIVCPKNLMWSAWVDDIMATCIHRTHRVLYGDRQRREQLCRESEAAFDIVNFDGIEILKDLLKVKQYDLVIIDESTAYKDASTRRWKALASLVTPDTRIWALTGTPTPQGPMDAYGQGKLVTPERMPRTKTLYQSMVQFKVATYIWKNKPNWQDTVRELLQPAIYINKADCLDLPPVSSIYREVGVSSAQGAAIQALKKDMLANFSGDHQVVVENAAVLHGKLRQIYAGGIYTSDGMALALDNKARLAECVELIERARAEGDHDAADGKPHSKALVFVPFKHAMQVVKDELEKHFQVAVISGDTSVHDRRNILRHFQEDYTIDVILAIPEAFSHGVTATAASLIVWYAPPSRTETYLQACERTNRPGQTQHQVVAHLYGDAGERSMYDALIENQQGQERLLQLYYNFIGRKP